MRYLPYFLLAIISLAHLDLTGQATTPIIGHYTLIDSLLQKEYDGRPGIVVLASKDGQVVFRNHYGMANLEKSLPLSTDMIFEIGSMTKQFTSTAVLQLVEQGLVRLDDPIQKYVPYFPEKAHTVTIHHLLSQTSGIPEFFDVDEDEFHILNTKHTPEELIAYYKDRPLNFVPGSQFEYSNSNYPLLGVVIESVSQLPLSAYFEQALFGPLGMANTSLWYQQEAENATPIPLGYRRNQHHDLVRSPPVTGSTVYAAGGIVSTLADLNKWNQELASPTILSKKIIKQLTKENKTLNNDKTGYGYGFFIENFAGYRSIQHGGNMYGFTSTGMYLPKAEVFVCVLSNLAFENTKNIAKYLAGAIVGKPTPYYRQLNAQRAARYFGKYVLEDPSIERKAEIKMYEGQLLLHFPEHRNNDVILYSVGGDKFVSNNGNITIEFKTDAAGEISYFIGVQDKEYVFQKTE